MGTRPFLILLIILFTVACRNREVKPISDEPIRVEVTAISEETISIPVHTNGILVSREEFKLSFKIGGIISKIYVEDGERVKKGDLLATLNLSEISANVNQAMSGYDKALRDFRRAENLFRDSVVTLEQKQNAATALNVAQATLEIAQFNLTHSKIIAPDNGMILKRFSNENEMVSSGYPVFLFGSSGKSWKVKAGISDREIVKVNRGDSAAITFDAYPGMKFSGIVDLVGEISNPYTGTYEIELLVAGNGLRLASGFVAGIDLFPSTSKTFSMIPVGSIVEAQGQKGYVYLVTETMIVQKIKVDIAALIGAKAAITGVPEGFTEVVSGGAAYLRDGMKVEVIR